MKKTLKISLIFAVLAMFMLSLTGCAGKKLVATKKTSADDSLFGAYEERIEITFKKDQADKIVWTMEFEDEDTAKTVAGFYEMAKSEINGLEINQDGKKIVLKMNAKDFADSSSLKDDLSRDGMKKSLEEAGYTVK